MAIHLTKCTQLQAQGFTLIEVLVVIVIVSILSTIGLANFLNIVHPCFQEPESCLNKDPIQKKCDRKPQTKAERQVEDIHIELRYSPKCNMTWARSTAPKGSEIFVVDLNKRQYGNYTIPADRYNQHYGDMGPGFAAGACVYTLEGELLCTDLAALIYTD
ncbi:DUF2690 domain-containing protein [Leptothoe sp. LEGE 181152]|nr:DUF2690 domain-containing protein [Leptothoe sp. LEGE 181152]